VIVGDVCTTTTVLLPRPTQDFGVHSHAGFSRLSHTTLIIMKGKYGETDCVLLERCQS